jgi:hypothetical protein
MGNYKIWLHLLQPVPDGIAADLIVGDEEDAARAEVRRSTQVAGWSGSSVDDDGGHCGAFPRCGGVYWDEGGSWDGSFWGRRALGAGLGTLGAGCAKGWSGDAANLDIVSDDCPDAVAKVTSHFHESLRYNVHWYFHYLIAAKS